VSSSGEERWKLYPLGPTGRSYHWCRWRLASSNRHSIVGYTTVHLQMETNPFPHYIVFSIILHDEQCSKQSSLNLTGFKVHLVHTMLYE
jgi:hypothetical protein